MDHTYSAADVQRTAILDLLRRVGDVGASEAEMVTVGGMWWRTRLKEIRRWRLAVIGEQNGRFYLVSDPEVERATGTSSRGSNEAATSTLESDAGLIPRASTGGSLSPTPTLFPPPPVSAIDPLEEAA